MNFYDDPDGFIGCYGCGAEIRQRDAAAHVAEKHPGVGSMQFYNVYHCSMRCSTCGEVREYAVPPGYGPDWMPRDSWHEPCPKGG